MNIAVTVDVEKDLGFLDSRIGVDEGLPVLLDLFRRYGVTGTFFVSGEILPHLVKTGFLRSISSDGHEIGAHGNRHADYRDWPYEDILHEIRSSKVMIENSLSAVIPGFRAPQFLINARIIRAVKESGFRYDSSCPAPGGIGAARFLRRVKVDASLMETIRRTGVREFPIDSVPLLKLPHGLLWINLISLTAYRWLFRLMKNDMSVFYLHPFDVAPHKERVPLDLKRRLFYLKNRGNISSLLEDLIRFWIRRGARFVTLGMLTSGG
jgi:peptidoglycan/xylan/chitin deacetylase (PgdA/CDA1 family)